MRRDGEARAQNGGVKPWLKKRWCIPSVGAEFVWRMEDVLDLYEEPHDEKRPVVCFDEMPCRLVAEVLPPSPAAPGVPARYDYEYERRGVANVFALFEPKGCWRHMEVTERRTAKDFALQMRALVEDYYPEAEKVRGVLDNLNTHTAAALYEAFLPEEADLAPPGVPLHAQARLVAQPGRDRVLGVGQAVPIGEAYPGHRNALAREISGWERERNERRATVEWRFTAEDAREKLSRLYPPQS
jgi:hypothetical protein